MGSTCPPWRAKTCSTPSLWSILATISPPLIVTTCLQRAGSLPDLLAVPASGPRGDISTDRGHLHESHGTVWRGRMVLVTLPLAGVRRPSPPLNVTLPDVR